MVDAPPAISEEETSSQIKRLQPHVHDMEEEMDQAARDLAEPFDDLSDLSASVASRTRHAKLRQKSSLDDDASTVLPKRSGYNGNKRAAVSSSALMHSGTGGDGDSKKSGGSKKSGRGKSVGSSKKSDGRKRKQG